MKKIFSVLMSFVMLISVAASLSLSAYADSQRTVLLNAGKGTAAPTSVELNADGTLPELPVPVRTGWEFVGWYTDAVEENYWGDEDGEDGTVLTFTSEYLDSLGTGEYEVTLISASGSVTTQLTVKNGNGEATSPSTGADKGVLIFAAIALADGAILTVKKKEQD